MDEGLLDQDGSWEPAGEGLWGDKSNTEDLKVFHDQVCGGCERAARSVSP